MAAPDKRKKIDDRDLKRQLDQEVQMKDHGRAQNVLDTLNRVACWAIYIIPTLVLLGILIIAGYWIYEKNWTAFTSNVERLLLLIGGYLISYLEKIGIKFPKKD